MTESARKALLDCEVALEMLESIHHESMRRVVWFGAVTLLRTVGDVLHKIDGKDPSLKVLIDASYERWKNENEKNAIFWEFIKAHRDALVHEYEFRIDNNEVIQVAIQAPDGGTTFGDISDNLFRPIVSGYGAGEDARDIYCEAIRWWKSELTEIESSVNGT